MLSFLKSRLLAIGAGVLAVLAGIIYIYQRGVSATKAKMEKQKLEEYKETRKQIDESESPSTPDAALDWLRKRNSRK